MRLRNDCSRPTPSPRLQRVRGTAATVLSALLAAFLMAVATACGLTVDDADLEGTFEEEDASATIELRSDGTGTLRGYSTDYPELAGNWERHLDSIDFTSDLGLTSIQINSADELWIWTNVDRGERRVFERISDEVEAAESPTASPGAEEPGAPCAELSALLDAAQRLLSDMEVDAAGGVPGEQVRLDAADLTLYGLQVEPLVSEDLAADARILADAGAAITATIDNGGTLTDVMSLWIAPDVLDAQAAVQVHYDLESGC